MKIIVTGGAGFIGSAVIRQYVAETDHTIINIDALTYAGNLHALEQVSGSDRYIFEHADIRDKKSLEDIFNRHQPDAVMHLAAESHVDRSIDAPADFIMTNVIGTFNLLDVSRHYRASLSASKKPQFRFHHVSTDEVYGDLPANGFFTEQTAYDPSSPYSASKASSDHLVRAWYRTYGLPVVITNCSNNYGAYQYPEKLIPLMILNAQQGRHLPVYGNGEQVRDWLYVDDHARALRLVLEKGVTGETYNVGGNSEKTNLQVVKTICAILDRLLPDSPYLPHESLIRFVDDRPGHDQRYAIDASKIRKELGWQPEETFESGIQKTIEWYLQNQAWCRQVQDGVYEGERLGLQMVGK